MVKRGCATLGRVKIRKSSRLSSKVLSDKRNKARAIKKRRGDCLFEFVHTSASSAVRMATKTVDTTAPEKHIGGT